MTPTPQEIAEVPPALRKYAAPTPPKLDAWAELQRRRYGGPRPLEEATPLQRVAAIPARAAIEFTRRAVVDPAAGVLRGAAWLGHEVLQDVKALAGQPEALAERVRTADVRARGWHQFTDALAQVQRNFDMLTPQQKVAVLGGGAGRFLQSQWKGFVDLAARDPGTAAGAVAGEAVLWFGPALYGIYKNAGRALDAADIAKDLGRTAGYFGTRPVLVAKMPAEIRAALQQVDAVQAEALAARTVRTSAGAEMPVDELIGLAQKHEPNFTAALKRVAADTGTQFGPDVHPQMARFTVKSAESIGVKAGKGKPVDDALRQTIVIPHPESSPGVVDQVVARLKAEGFDILNVKDRFKTGEAYKDVNIKLRIPGEPRLVAEVQLVTPRVLERKLQFGHDLYDVADKWIELARADAGDHPALNRARTVLDDAMRKVYQEALAEDLASSRARPIIARPSTIAAATEAGRPAVSAETGLPATREAAISARRMVSEPVTAAPPPTPIVPRPVTGVEAPAAASRAVAREAAAEPMFLSAAERRRREAALIRQQMAEAERAAAGEAPTPVQRPRAPAPAAPAAVGTKFRAETPAGTAVEGDYAIVSARDLIASHDTDLRVNPLYPVERQPRMREREASRRQLEEFVKNTRVERLGVSDDAARGAPIVDGLEPLPGGFAVDSGNMRAIGIQKLYETNHPNAQRYKDFIRTEAARVGIPPETVDAVTDPVLVRIRRTPVDVVQFNREANLTTQLKMSAVEVARADAQALDEGLLALFRPSDTGDVAAAGNRDFIARFIRKVAPTAAEQGDLLLPNGQLTRQGIARIQNAVLAKAYKDMSALEKMIEAPDINVRNIANAMLSAAPRFIELQGRIARGERYDFDIGTDVAAAMNLMSRLREEGTSVELYLQQTRLFGREASPEALRILEILDANKGSRKKMEEFLSAYTQMADAVGSPKQVQLVARDVPTKLDLIDRALDDVRTTPTATFDLLDRMRAETAQAVALQQQAGAVRLPIFGQVSPAAAGTAVRAADQAVEAVETARLRPQDFLAGLRHWWERFVDRAIDPLVYEPLLRDRPDLKNKFRLLKTAPLQGIDFGRRSVFAIRGDLQPQEYEVFRRWILQKSLEQDVQAGLRVPNNLTLDQVQARIAELERQFTPAVQRAIERHRDLTRATAADLVARGVLPADALEEHIYYPHRVLDFQQVFGDWIGMPRRLRSPYRSYARTKRGTVGLVNTDYDQVMADYFGQVYVHNKLDDFSHEIARTENILGRLSRQEKAALFGTETRTLRGRPVQVIRQPQAYRRYEIGGKGYIGFQPEPGRQIYPTLTTTEKLIDQVITGTLDAKDYADRVRRGFAMGRRKPVLLLPENVALRLMRFKQPWVPLPVIDQVAGFTNFWKGVTLNLGVPASYNINNELGDFLGSVAREIPWRELWKELPRIYAYRLKALVPTYRRLIKGKPLTELGPEWESVFRLAEENDVLASGLAMGEQRAASLLPMLNPAKLFQAASNIREASGRAAYYRWLLERSAAGKPLALSISARELGGLAPAAAAGKVAREAIVDYQAVSPTYRRIVNNLLFPFSTWYVHNAINYARYVKRNPGDALVKLLVPYVGLQVWNNTVWGDVEKDLPVYFRVMPHVITGHVDSEGKHVVVVLQHPAHLAGQMLGLDRIQDNVRRWQNGDFTLQEAVEQQVKDSLLGTPRLAWQMFSPMIKIMLVFGQKQSSTGAIRDPVTKRVIVPERLRNTPEERALLMQYVLEAGFVPLAQIYRTGRETDLEPPDFARKWAKQALNLERTVIKRVDIEKSRAFRISEAQDRMEALRASALEKLDQAYVRSVVERNADLYRTGRVEAERWFAEQVAREWRQAGGRGTPPAARLFAPTPGRTAADLMREHLHGTRVQLQIVRELLRRETDPVKRQELTRRLDALQAKATMEARKGAPKAIRPLVPRPGPAAPPVPVAPEEDPYAPLFAPAR